MLVVLGWSAGVEGPGFDAAQARGLAVVDAEAAGLWAAGSAAAVGLMCAAVANAVGFVCVVAGGLLWVCRWVGRGSVAGAGPA